MPKKRLHSKKRQYIPKKSHYIPRNRQYVFVRELTCCSLLAIADVDVCVRVCTLPHKDVLPAVRWWRSQMWMCVCVCVRVYVSLFEVVHTLLVSGGFLGGVCVRICVYLCVFVGVCVYV